MKTKECYVYEVGDKVVPFQKTRGNPHLFNCNAWADAKRIGQKFLYVVSLSSQVAGGLNLCAYEGGWHDTTSYYSHDVTPYVKPEPEIEIPHVYKKGDKVVPHAKSGGGYGYTLSECPNWTKAQAQKQEFLYVYMTSSNNTNSSQGGDIYLSHSLNDKFADATIYKYIDLTPYIEPEIIIKENIKPVSYVVKIDELVRLYNIGYIQKGTDIRISKV